VRKCTEADFTVSPNCTMQSEGIEEATCGCVGTPGGGV